MATVLSRCAAVAAKMARPCPKTPPPVHERVYHADLERGLPLQNMRPVSESQDGLRLRQSSNNPQHQEESPPTSGTLTPSSSATSPGTKVSERRSSLRVSWESASSGIKSALFGPSAEEIKDTNHRLGYDRFIYSKVDDYPEGLPRLASLIVSDSDFTIFRGFKQCHSRVLLQLEVEITELEKELFQLDKSDETSSTTNDRLRNTKFKDGDDTAQRDMLKELRLKLLEYDELVLKYNQTQGLGKPGVRNHHSVWHWIQQRKPLHGGYYDFIFHSEDFLSIGVSDPDFNFFVELILAYVNRYPRSVFKKLLKTDHEHKKTSDPNVNIYSSARLSVIGKLIGVSLAVALLLIPVFLLFLVPMRRGVMAVTALSFVFFFSLVVSTMTPAKIHEVFFGTATYCAVLIVFLGAVNQGTLVVAGS